MFVDKGLIDFDGERWLPTGDLADRGRPADDPGAAGGPPRRPVPRGAGSSRARLGDRPRIRPDRDRGAGARYRAGRGRRPPASCWIASSSSRSRARGCRRGLVYRFRNLMIKDATYGSLLKRARAQFHERFVNWAERVNRERGREQEFEEILGYHLEQAYRYRRELGQVDDGGSGHRRPRDGQARRCRAARLRPGRPARRRPACCAGPRRSSSRTTPTGSSCSSTSRRSRSRPASSERRRTILDEASRTATELGDDRLAARSVVTSTAIRLLSEELKSGELETMRAVARGGHCRDQAASDVASGPRARGACSRRWRAWRAETTRPLQALQRVIDLARKAGDRRLANRAAAGLANTMFAGDATASEVSARTAPACWSASRAIARPRPSSSARRPSPRRCRATSTRRGTSTAVPRRTWRTSAGARCPPPSPSSRRWSRCSPGEPSCAAELLRADDAQLEHMGERYFRSSITGRLAHALEAMDELDEAAPLRRPGPRPLGRGRHRVPGRSGGRRWPRSWLAQAETPTTARAWSTTRSRWPRRPTSST